MIPYFEVPSLPIPRTSVAIHAFGVLVALGIVLGVAQVLRRGRQLGLDPYALSSMCTWGIATGFVISHLFDVAFYQPQVIHGLAQAFVGAAMGGPLGRQHHVEDFGRHLLTLLNPGAGLSSFGGFLGMALGILLWRWRRRQPLRPFLDAAVYGGTTGWLLGRLGCFTAHDHPGKLTEFFLAVDFGQHEPGGVRHDLGLDEALFTLGLVIADRLLIRRPRPAGFYVAMTALAYGPARFLLDFLRIADERYLGLTPAQWGCLALTGFGLAEALRLRRGAATPPAPPTAAPHGTTAP